MPVPVGATSSAGLECLVQQCNLLLLLLHRLLPLAAPWPNVAVINRQMCGVAGTDNLRISSRDPRKPVLPLEYRIFRHFSGPSRPRALQRLMARLQSLIKSPLGLAFAPCLRYFRGIGCGMSGMASLQNFATAGLSTCTASGRERPPEAFRAMYERLLQQMWTLRQLCAVCEPTLQPMCVLQSPGP